MPNIFVQDFKQSNSPDIHAQHPFSIIQCNTRQKKTFTYIKFPRINIYKNSPIYRMCYYFNIYASDLDLDNISVSKFHDLIDQKLFASQAQT